MDQTSTEIKRDIQETRRDMTDKLDAIETRVKAPLSSIDIRGAVERRPLETMALALASGVVLGMLRSNSEHQRSDRVHDTYRRIRDTASGLRPDDSPSLTDQLLDQFGDELDIAKAAVVTAATAMAKDWVKDALPFIGSSRRRERTEATNGHQKRSTV